MSTQQATSSKVSSSLDTSHLKVKFPFKAKYGNYINGKFVEPKSGKYFDNTSQLQMKLSVRCHDRMKKILILL